jgi:hypothetical protein
MDKRFVFILSAGRTGTQFLGDRLSQAIDDCWSEHEADAFDGLSAKSWERIQRFGLWHVVLGRALGKTGLRAASMQYLTGQITLEQASEWLHRERDPHYVSRPERLIIDSYPRWWAFAGAMDQMWLGAKTVTIIRDPRQWITSFQSHHKSESGQSWSNHFPPGPLTPHRIGDGEWAKRWATLSPVGRIAWRWREVNQRLHAASLDSEFVKMFRYEDLFVAESPAMADLIRFASDHGDIRFTVRPMDPTKIARSNASSAKDDDWLGWSDKERAEVEELCGPLMDIYGYDRASLINKQRQAG